MTDYNGNRSLRRKKMIFAVICVIVWVFSPSFCNIGYGMEYSHGASIWRTTSNKEHQYIPVLMYHHFSRSIMGNGSSGVTITTEKFNEDMEYLSDNGYCALLPDDLTAISEGRMRVPEKPIIITFDDGYESAYLEAFPVLKKTGMKAIVFMIVGSVENEKGREIPKLKWAEMKEMYDSGFVDIQSHSYNLHNSYNGGKYEMYTLNGITKGLIESKAQYVFRVEPDIVKSIELIEENVGNKVTCFSYPYGVYEEDGKEILVNNGIKFAFVTRYGVADIVGTPYKLNRFVIGMNTELQQLLEPEKEDIYGKGSDMYYHN